MFRKLLLALAFALAATSAQAQNTTCSNRPNGDTSNACANTRFVQTAIPLAGITVGSPINSGTAWGALYNNNGVLGNTAAGTSGYFLGGNGSAAPTFQAFTQPLTGGVARTWQSKAQEVVSLKDFGAACDGSTDDSTAIQAAVTALPSSGGRILVPATGVNCTFGTTITTGSKRNVVFQGQSSVAATTVASSLVYTGTGARVFDARDSNGWAWNNLSITVTNNAFNGTIIDCGGTNPGTTVSHYCAIDRVTLNGNGTNTPTCFNASEAVEFVVNQSNFNSCDIGIRGQQVLSQSTVGKILSTQFFATKTMPISDCGESWSIIGNTFEQLATSNNAGGISINSARPCKNVTIQGNWFGDANATGTWIALSANGASITGNRIANGAVGIALTGGAGYSIRNNNMENTTAFSCASSPTGGEIASNVYTGVTTYLSGTCVNFNIQGISGTALTSQLEMVNATSGSIKVVPSAGALGSLTQTLQARTGNIPSIDGTLAVASGKTATVNNTLTLTGTDGVTVPFGTRTRQTFTSGSGTYTTPANVKYILVRMVGGGGGGGGGGTGAPTAGGAGGNTTFSTATAGGGGGGAAAALATGRGTGGTASGGTFNTVGGSSGAVQAGINVMGTNGASTPFGGGGGGGISGLAAAAGAANTGAGGGGGGQSAGSLNVGSGGGAGGYVEFLITAPAATYSYAVGGAGSAGSAGTNGNAGAAGAAGVITVDEFYQ